MNEKKHILVVSQYFYPEQFRINDICTEWVRRGYQVTVLTGIPNYPQGKYFEGYDLVHKRTEEWNGIRITRIPLVPRGHSSISLVANYFSFVLSGYVWKCLTKIKADYVFTFEVSPMTQALVGVWYAKKNHIPHYLYVQDLWPENVETVTGIHSPLVLKPIRKMVRYIYKNCSHIFATSPSFVKEICKQGVPEEKVHYWPQYAEEFYRPMEKRPVLDIPDDGSFKIIFTGNIGTAQGLEILPRTAELLKTENVKFVMVGDGRYLEAFNNDVKKKSVQDKFIMISRKPAEKIPELLAACDVAFLSFQDEELWTMTIPAKLQSYMACGMPVIAAAKGETERVIEEAECGRCCGIGKPEALAETVRELQKENLSAMKRSSRKYFEQNFDKAMLMEQIAEYF